jgi:hypothetical protein
LEAVLDELTAEVMKINLAPQMVTSEVRRRPLSTPLLKPLCTPLSNLSPRLW